MTTRHERAWVVTGPTSGIGRRTALELAKHGSVVLVGRDPAKLDAVKSEIETRRGHAVAVRADFSDLASVRRAAAEVIALKLPIAGVVNNAGIFPLSPGKTAQGWDAAFATNHLGPFAFTEALVPHLADGTDVIFVCSAVEDPERRPAVASGFRGGRYISAEASLRGEWLQPGGSSKPGYDAYATSKLCNLATVLAFTRETPRLRFQAVEPGLNVGTGLGRDANLAVRLLAKHVIAPIGPLFIRMLSTPGRAARIITNALLDESSHSGTYYDERGRPMLGSTQVRDPEFADRVVAETRALLAALSDDQPDLHVGPALAPAER